MPMSASRPSAGVSPEMAQQEVQRAAELLAGPGSSSQGAMGGYGGGRISEGPSPTSGSPADLASIQQMMQMTQGANALSPIGRQAMGTPQGSPNPGSMPPQAPSPVGRSMPNDRGGSHSFGNASLGGQTNPLDQARQQNTGPSNLTATRDPYASPGGQYADQMDPEMLAMIVQMMQATMGQAPMGSPQQGWMNPQQGPMQPSTPYGNPNQSPPMQQEATGKIRR